MAIYYIGSIPESEYLQHFGIQGMKWGVRRFQNSNGSLTSEGKARYRVAGHMERKTLENLQKVKQNSRRTKMMSKRQKERLDKDIDFYKKRLTGEVKKKNFVSRHYDLERSMNFGERATRQLVTRSLIKVYIKSNQARDDGLDFSLVDAGKAALSGLISGGTNLAISELYNRAVGRY